MEIVRDFQDETGLIYYVTSERDESITYVVAVDIYDGWYCTCEDYKFRKHKCKHIKEVLKHLQKHYKFEYEKYNQLDVFVNIIKK